MTETDWEAAQYWQGRTEAAEARIAELDEDLAEAKRALSKRIAADNGYRVLHDHAQNRISDALDVIDEPECGNPNAGCGCPGDALYRVRRILRGETDG